MLGEYAIDARLAEEKPWEWRPEFLSVNAGGNLPVLLTEVAAIPGLYPISEFLTEQLYASPQSNEIASMLPEDPFARAETRRMVDWFYKKFNDEVWSYIYYEKVEGPARNDQPPNPEAIRTAIANFRNHLSYLSRILEERYWLGGDHMSIADLTAAAHFSTMDFLGDVPWDQIPIIKNWYARIKSRPAFRPLLQDVMPGIVPPNHYADLDF